MGKAASETLAVSLFSAFSGFSAFSIFFRPFRFLSSFRGFFPNSGFLFGYFGKRRFYLRRFFLFIDCGGLGGRGGFRFHPFLCPFFAAVILISSIANAFGLISM